MQQQERLLSPLMTTDRLTKGILGSAYTNPLGDIFRQERAMFNQMNSSLISKPILPEFHRPFIPKPHNPEAFYYRKWKKGFPETKGVITCDLWRHQEGKVDFEIDVLFAGVGAKNGRVVCEVHAGNLTKPFTTSVAVRRSIVEHDFIEDIGQMIEET